MAKTYQTGPAGARAAGETVVRESATIAVAKIAESAKEGLLALAVGAGLQVMQAMMDESVLEVCGPSVKHNPDRAGYRHGSQAGSVTLGGRRVPVTRPRVRAADGSGSCPRRPTSCSPLPSCSGRWRWSGCSPGCRPAVTGSGRNRWASR